MPYAETPVESPVVDISALLDFSRPRQEIVAELYAQYPHLTLQPQLPVPLAKMVETPSLENPDPLLEQPDQTQSVKEPLPAKASRAEEAKKNDQHRRAWFPAIGRLAARTGVALAAVAAFSHLAPADPGAESEIYYGEASVAKSVAATPATKSQPPIPVIEAEPTPLSKFTLADLMPKPARPEGYTYQTALQTAKKLSPMIRKSKSGRIDVLLIPEDTTPTSSWLTSSALNGLMSYAKAFPNARYGLTPEEIANAIKVYWDPNPNTLGYATVVEDTKGVVGTDRFIDDGMWDAALRLQCYALQLKQGNVPDASALAEVQSMVDIAKRNVSRQGLVYWLDQKQEDHTVRPGGPNRDVNTISAGLSAEVALQLNKFLTNPGQIQNNLEFATRIYNGTRAKMLDLDDNLYYDHADYAGNIDQTKLPYNAGVMISAGMWLYEATGDQQYLAQAEQTARGGLKMFDPNTLQFNDPFLVLPYLDRLYSLSLVTTDKELRSHIDYAIKTYAAWYAQLASPNQVPITHRITIQTQNGQEHVGFKSSQLNAIALAALVKSDTSPSNPNATIEAGRHENRLPQSQDIA